MLCGMRINGTVGNGKPQGEGRCEGLDPVGDDVRSLNILATNRKSDTPYVVSNIGSDELALGEGSRRPTWHGAEANSSPLQIRRGAGVLSLSGAAYGFVQRILGFVVFSQRRQVLGACLGQVLLGLEVFQHNADPILFALARQPQRFGGGR